MSLILPQRGRIRQAAAGGVAKTITYQDTDSATSGTSQSFTGKNFGTEHADRIIMCAWLGYSTTNNGLRITSGTIGGVTGNIVNVTPTTAQITGSYMWANVPTGTSGTVAFSTTTAPVRAGLGVWELQGFDPATFGTVATPDRTAGSGTTGTVTLGVSTAADDAFFTTSYVTNGTGLTYDAGVTTIDYNFINSNRSMSGGGLVMTGVDASYDQTLSWTNSSTFFMHSSLWRD